MDIVNEILFRRVNEISFSQEPRQDGQIEKLDEIQSRMERKLKKPTIKGI